MSKPKFKLHQEIRTTYKDNAVDGYVDEVHSIQYSAENIEYFYKIRICDQYIVNYKTGFGKLVSKAIIRKEEFINKL